MSVEKQNSINIVEEELQCVQNNHNSTLGWLKIGKNYKFEKVKKFWPDAEKIKKKTWKVLRKVSLSSSKTSLRPCKVLIHNLPIGNLAN